MRAVRPLLALAVLSLAGGCAPSLQGLAGDEAGRAASFFAAAGDVRYPVAGSWSGVMTFLGDTVPFVAGVNAPSSLAESAGIFDPLGRAVLLIQGNSAGMTVSPGPAADQLLDGIVGRRLECPAWLDTGPFSVARILSGAPGYPVRGPAAFSRGADGEWVLEDGTQTLRSDPGRRHLAEADYRFGSRRVRVKYPGRDGPSPPRQVTIDLPGGRIELRRDEE